MSISIGKGKMKHFNLKIIRKNDLGLVFLYEGLEILCDRKMKRCWSCVKCLMFVRNVVWNSISFWSQQKEFVLIIIVFVTNCLLMIFWLKFFTKLNKLMETGGIC